jgi:hypothetical protein
MTQIGKQDFAFAFPVRSDRKCIRVLWVVKHRFQLQRLIRPYGWPIGNVAEAGYFKD